MGYNCVSYLCTRDTNNNPQEPADLQHWRNLKHRKNDWRKERYASLASQDISLHFTNMLNGIKSMPQDINVSRAFDI